MLGKIIGKSSTNEFQFLVEGNAKKFQYIKIPNKGEYVLATINEIEKDYQKTIAYCSIIGYQEDNILKKLKYPLEPNTEVFDADDELITKTLGLEGGKDALFIGKLEGRNINIYLDINKLLTRHIAILAKSGAGKSYTLGVFLEELLEKKVPIIIIDPHGEYSSLKDPNTEETEKLKKFNISPTSYSSQIQEFSPNTMDNPQAKPFKLNNKDLSSGEFIHLLPAKLSNAQLGLFYSSLRNIKGRIDLNEIITELANEDNNAKWGLINIVEYLQKLELFSDDYTKMYEIIKPGKLSILNLRGVNTDIQEIIVYKLVKDLFNERKIGNIPPFFLVIEEGHNYIPERTYGETKSSSILRQVFAEGRKFGLGICIVSQRPSRIEKNALSQVNTQIILNTTNPNDVKAISNSVEGINSGSEKEIKNLPVGTAMLTGIVDTPIFVNIRPRKTKHGGKAIDIFNKEGNLMPIILPNENIEDLKLIYKEIKTNLIPCSFLTCEDKSSKYNFLINLTNGNLIEDINNPEGTRINFPNLQLLSPQQERVFLIGSLLKEFKPAEIFSKSGMQFSEVYEIINSLTKKGYFVKKDDKYSIGFDDFFRITEKAIFNGIDFKKISYDNLLEKKKDIDIIKNSLSKFFRITNEKECYLVNYLKSA